MPCFTPTQLEDLAQQYKTLSNQTRKVRLTLLATGSMLNDPKIVSLFEKQTRLLQESNKFAVKAADLVLDNADKAAATIVDSTGQAIAALDKLRDINKALTIASAALTLAAAIYTADLPQIAAASKTLTEASIAKKDA